jgi:hypothetical protein
MAGSEMNRFFSALSFINYLKKIEVRILGVKIFAMFRLMNHKLFGVNQRSG